MTKKIYVCPKHNDQVLYVEIDDPGRTELIDPGKPKECPKCGGTAYYKWECKEKK